MPTELDPIFVTATTDREQPPTDSRSDNAELSTSDGIISPIEGRVIRCILYAGKQVAVTSADTNLAQGINLMPLLSEINVYENMFTNCISGNILISDSQSLLNYQSWSGEEYLLLTLTDNLNQRDIPEYRIHRLFKVYSISRRQLHTENNESYFLNFCSEEMILSEKYRVSKTYKNQRISDMVKDIALNYLKIDPKEFPDSNIEPTFGTYNITVPNLKPIQAINWLCNFAISNGLADSTNSGATYFFWQTKNGYYFKSILGLFKSIDFIESMAKTGSMENTNWYRGKHSSVYGYIYGVKNIDYEANHLVNFTEEEEAKYPFDDDMIISYKVLNTFNAVENIQQGLFANKLFAINLVTRSKEEIVFDYSKYFNNYLKPNINLYKKFNQNSVMPTNKDRFEKSYNECNENIIKIVPTTSRQLDNKFVGANENTIRDSNIELTLPLRQAQLGLLGLNRLKIVIPGDTAITVGVLVRVSIPEATLANINGKDLDGTLSGFYLVTNIRHIINKSGEYKSVLELRKDSYSKIGASKMYFDNNNDLYNKVLKKGTLK